MGGNSCDRAFLRANWEKHENSVIDERNIKNLTEVERAQFEHSMENIISKIDDKL